MAATSCGRVCEGVQVNGLLWIIFAELARDSFEVQRWKLLLKSSLSWRGFLRCLMGYCLVLLSYAGDRTAHHRSHSLCSFSGCDFWSTLLCLRSGCCGARDCWGRDLWCRRCALC